MNVPDELVMLPGAASWLPTVVMNGVVDAYLWEETKSIMHIRSVLQ